MIESSAGVGTPDPGEPNPGEGSESPPSLLAWPPPGLERMQGDLWGIAVRGAAAGAVLVLPLLFVIARQGDSVSQGPLGNAGWVVLLLSVVGLGFTIDALVTTYRVLRRCARALDQGYDLRTVFLVLADQSKDMGFLLQGGRHFSLFSPEERSAVASMRLGAILCYALGTLWLPIALCTGLLLASRGLLTPQSLWLTTLMPSVILGASGLLVRLVEDQMVRRIRTRWFAQPWAADLVQKEIRGWREGMAARAGKPLEEKPFVLGSRALRGMAWVVVALLVITALPVLTLVPSSAVGSILANIAVPAFGRIGERAAKAEAYRYLRLDADPALTPQDAAGLLTTLLYVGSTGETDRSLRPPSQSIEEEWIPNWREDGPIGVNFQRWPEEIFSRVTDNPSPEVRAFLADLADHPGHILFSRLSHASAVDQGSAIWITPFPENTNFFEVPIPKLSSLRTAGYAHLAAAAHDLLEGRPAAAEEKVREVISVGLLLGDNGNTLIENLSGYVVAGNGVTGLVDLYRATGREEEAALLEGRLQAAERGTAMARGGGGQSLEEYLRVMPEVVLDENQIQGLRWEFLGTIATITPCLNLQRMVFGPGENYESFLAQAREDLVEYPSQAALFDVVSNGYWGPEPEGDWLGRLLGVSMRPGPGSCKAVVKQYRALRTLR